jgi:hypothetical protein
MFVLVRAVTYAALFIGFVMVYLTARFLSWALLRPQLPERRVPERRCRSSRKAMSGRAKRVAPGIEQGDTARFPQC